jgi:ATP-dependent protease ClpP protease subunit
MNTKPTNSYDDCASSIEPFMLTAKPAGIEYRVDIDETFVHPRQFAYIVNAMEHATEYDSFQLNLTTCGGALHAVLPLLGAMQDTHAHVHVNACSDVASAGTFLLMRADSISMNEYSTIMCHNVSFGSGGSGWNVEKHVEHTLKSSKRLLRDMYKHFFSTEEIERMLTGTDFYMSKDEFVERYEKRSELLAADREGQQEDDEEAIIAAIEAEIAAREAAEQEAVKEDKKPARAKRVKKTVDTTK